MKHLSISDDEYQSYLNGEITLDNLAEKYSVCSKTIINKLNKEGKVSRLKYRQEVQEACFRWNTRKMAESERFSHMFHSSIGLVKPNREFVLCEVA